MKSLNIFFAGIMLLFYILINLAAFPLPEKETKKTAMDISLSHHDFSGASWTNYEMCSICHTPHNANLEITGSPLWNHENTVATFQVYSSPTMQGIPGQPGGKTKLCLSCHDGTVAMENHGGSTGGSYYIGGPGNITTNLRDDHPVSFIYNSQLAQADGKLHDPSTTPSGLGGTIAEDLLDEGMLDCSTCHDVHVSRNTQGCIGCHIIIGGGTMITRTLSLRIPNEGSQLCLTCHNK